MKSFVFFQEIPNVDWIAFDDDDDDEPINESAFVSLKTWFLGNDCRSCRLVMEENCRDLDRRRGLAFEESLLKYKNIEFTEKRIELLGDFFFFQFW